MNNDTNITFGIRFSKINVLRYSQYDTSKIDESKTALIEYQTNFQLKVLKESNEIVILATIKLILIETKELFAELKVESFFDVKSFDNAVKRVGDGFKIPNDLLLNLTSIVIGTIRGILHEKLKGTPIQKEVFPLVDTQELLIKGVENK